MSDPRDPLIGTILGGTFRVMQPLGAVGMGAVFLAEHLRLPRPLHTYSFPNDPEAAIAAEVPDFFAQQRAPTWRENPDRSMADWPSRLSSRSESIQS